MLPIRKPLHRSSRQKGQSIVEYIVVTSLGVLVLTTPVPQSDDPDATGGKPPRSAIGMLVDALKDAYNSYAYSISLSTTITPF
ncbi:MAG TPA: hypothetical protein VMT94_09830 [Burkholderiales bacterium]|nr:hypothetical protein [Burkholderiales bacterium]